MSCIRGSIVPARCLSLADAVPLRGPLVHLSGLRGLRASLTCIQPRQPSPGGKLSSGDPLNEWVRSGRKTVPRELPDRM